MQKVSIIVPTFNKSKILTRCLDHVFKYTSLSKTPFEVIVVDDGSTEDIKEAVSKYDVKRVRCEKNSGFPSAVNAGANIAEGDFICLLNNDCFVTEGWLESMLRTIRSGSSLVAVGPHANNVSGAQNVSVNVKDPAQLDLLVKKFQAQEKYVDRLVFFCVLIKISVWKELGGLDEDFNPGNFEDNYFSWLCRQKGYRLKTVSHFVWHEGGATFGYTSQDPTKQQAYRKLLALNQKKFCRKIGQYRTIGLCMIVADFEDPQVLKRCLDSIAPFVDEVNIVFNYKGIPRQWKVNKLKEVAKGYNVRTCYEKFTTFSDMRNLSLDMATTEYCLWQDTDDVSVNPPEIRAAIQEFPEADYFKCRVISKNPKNRGSDLILHNRLVKNKPEYRFRNSVHEDISFSLLEKKGVGVLTEITVEHLGYLDDSLHEKKNTRNLTLLEKDIREGNAHSLTYFHLVNSLILLGTFKARERAVVECDKCFELFDLKPEDPLLSKMWVLRGIACMGNKQTAAAKQSFIKALIARPDHPEAKLNLGCILLDEGKLDEALEHLQAMWDKKMFNVGTNMAFNFHDIEAILLKTLGDCYFKKNQAEIDKKEGADPKKIAEFFQKSEHYYRLALKMNPRQIDVADRLVQIFRITKRMNEANLLTAGMVNMFPGYFSGWFNLAQTEILQQRFETARVFLEKCLEINPKYEEALHNMRILDQTRVSR